MTAVDPFIPLVVEADASVCATAASLRQSIVFITRILLQSEQQHSAKEKKAYATMEALKK